MTSSAGLKLILLVFLLKGMLSFKTFRIVEENRDIPPWPSYQYMEKVDGDQIIREYILQEQDQRTYILCPRGFVIGQLGVALLLGPDQVEKEPELKAKQVAFKHVVSKALELPSNLGDRIEPAAEKPENLCPTLERCLMYQACVFNFGNELCLKDPNPGTRKNLDVNVTCVRDAAFQQMLNGVRTADAEAENELIKQAKQKYKERKNQVLNIMYESKLDYGIEDFPNTVLTNRAAAEDFVFVSMCPDSPKDSGYHGECNRPAGEIPGPEEVGQNTWHLTSRVRSDRCKERLVQVYCAFQFNREGKCVPPHLLENPLEAKNSNWQGRAVWGEAAYPLRGPRPVDDLAGQQAHLENYKLKNLLPVRIAFALLLHKDVPAIMQLLLAIYRPHHFYVLHVDKRKEEVRQELKRQVAQTLPAHNVVVLPVDRSYVTSWGGMGIVRAHLEVKLSV